MLTRDVFLYLAKQKRARDMIMGFGLSRRAALRFVAGEDMDAAMKAVTELNRQGIQATLDHLGENVVSADDARQATADYLALLDGIAASGVQSHVSLKLTQLGLDVGDEFCYSCIEGTLERAAKHNNFVRIDMEGSEYTDRTIRIFKDLRARHNNVGIVIQSYLYRSANDIEELIPLGANIRLCKGAYKEPAAVAFPRKFDVDRNYVALMERLLGPDARSQGAYIAIATHDAKIIDRAKEYVRENDVPRDAFEFQMLYGVRRDLQRQLVSEGYRVRIYVPYGKEWYPYFMRRLAERPANVVFLLRGVVGEWSS